MGQTVPLSNEPIKKTQKPEKIIPAESLKAPNKHVDQDEIILPTQTPDNSVYKQEKMDTDADTDSEITPSVEVNQKTVHTFMEQFFIHAFFDIFRLFSTNNNTFHYDSILY